MASTDEQRILRALREVLDAPGTSGKHLAAKAAAARQLSILTGLQSGPADAGAEREVAEDPMADLDDLEVQRKKRARKW